jgi:hypothetical protein
LETLINICPNVSDLVKIGENIGNFTYRSNYIYVNILLEKILAKNFTVNTLQDWYIFSRKSCRLRHNYEKYGTASEAKDDLK